jgi:hypothetical protein
MKNKLFFVIAILPVFFWIFQGCGGKTEESVQTGTDGIAIETADLMDDRYPKASAGEPGWDYAVTATADLDGDGRNETVVLVANISLHDDRPAWNDGQAWQAYVIDSKGERTDLYRQFIQLGNVSLAVSERRDGGTPAVLLAENSANHIRVIEFHYQGPQKTDASEVLHRNLIVSPEPLRPSGIRKPARLDPESGKT